MVKVLVSGVLLLAVGVAIFPIFDYVIHIELEKVCDYNKFLPSLLQVLDILAPSPCCIFCLLFYVVFE